MNSNVAASGEGYPNRHTQNVPGLGNQGVANDLGNTRGVGGQQQYQQQPGAGREGGGAGYDQKFQQGGPVGGKGPGGEYHGRDAYGTGTNGPQGYQQTSDAGGSVGDNQQSYQNPGDTAGYQQDPGFNAGQRTVDNSNYTGDAGAGPRVAAHPPGTVGANEDNYGARHTAGVAGGTGVVADRDLGPGAGTTATGVGASGTGKDPLQTGTAQTIAGKLQQAGGMLLSSQTMKEKGLARENRAHAADDINRAQQMEQEAGLRRERVGQGVHPAQGGLGNMGGQNAAALP